MIVSLALAGGLLAGLLIAAVAVGLEHSRIAFGPFALSGNGALIAPGLGAPLALYFGWLRLARGTATVPLVPAAAYAVGLDVGIGAAVVVGGAVYWLFASGRIPANALTLTLGFLIGIPFGLVMPLMPIALVTGSGLAAAMRARSTMKIVLIAIAMVIAILSPFALVPFAGGPTR